MSGYFELVRHDPPGQTQEVSEREARRLLAAHVRDTRHALRRLRAAPYGTLSCDGGALRYCPTPELWVIDEAHHVADPRRPATWPRLAHCPEAIHSRERPDVAAMRKSKDDLTKAAHEIAAGLAPSAREIAKQYPRKG